VRIEVIARPSCPDGRLLRLTRSLARAFPPGVQAIAIVDVYLLEGVPALPRAELSAIFCDPVAQDALFDEPAAVSRAAAGHGAAPLGWDLLVEVTARPGVTDPVALTAREALGHSLGAPLPHGAIVQTAVQYLIAGWGSPDASRLARFFHNPLVQAAEVISRAEWGAGKHPAGLYPHQVPESRLGVETFDLAVMVDARLVELSRARLLALSLDEMKAVRAWAALRGGPVTDVELEMIAQTWSEHCKHKIFNATIHHREAGREETIRSLFKTCIRSTTERLAGRRRFLRSVFHDNSGVVAFDRRALVCFKVETHNSPSALDPYGGAITGIVGVNRDIMGTGKGARPIFNTNVLCFGWPDTPETDVPAGLLHPRRVMEGVHRGIVDGGNQSGIPVVAGGFVFDESYLGKPLVFCGTGGILPARVRGRPSWERAVEPGDLAVMVGGRIGKDGIHGATFSSEALSSSSPTSAVQIGDPITQKKACDLLLEARDLGLYRGLTDNGAGGLSSSLGEMATLSGGVRIDLDRCPLKYPGLAPWEVLLSESQERMSLAVPPQRLDAFLALAKRRGVEAAAVGEFTADGFVEVTSGGRRVARVDLAFLHEGLPTMELRSEWIEPERREAADGITAAPTLQAAPPACPDLSAMLGMVLSDPNIRSREEWVRQYDHEVQGRSVVKPFVGVRREAPSDGAVLRLRPDARIGITVTHGIAPRYGDWDAYDMAQCVVDEAVRGHVALGGDPRLMAGLDNFCWPDPVEGPENPDGAYKLAQLVRACRGLADACAAYGLPLISGKDSMKNDARVGGRRISVRPTLLVSLLGVVPDVRRSITTDFKRPGDQVWLVGTSRGELGGTVYERISGQRLGACPSLVPDESVRLYRRIHRAARRGLVASCHDLSDGGLWTALAESALGGGLGAEVSLDSVPAGRPLSAEQLLFGETPGRLLVSVGPRSERRFRRMMRGLAAARIGVVAAGEKVRMTRGGAEVGSMTIDDIRAAWKNVGAAREDVPGEPRP
jgi:phosphoribosylformylglycinamidine synthase